MTKGRFDQEESLTFTKTQVYLILGCIVAIAVLSFSLGHLVSRSTVTAEAEKAGETEKSISSAKEVLKELNKLEKRLKEMEALKDEPFESAGTTEIQPEPFKPRMEIVEDKNVVELSFEPETEEMPAQEPEEVPPGSIKVKSLAKSPLKEAQAPINKMLNPQKKMARKKEVRPRRTGTIQVSKVTAPPIPPASKLPPGQLKPFTKQGKTRAVQTAYIPADSKYTVQVKTFATEDEAKELENELKKKGYHAYTHTLARSRRTWFRVRVGGFKSRSKADEMARKLKDKEGLTRARSDRYRKP